MFDSSFLIIYLVIAQRFVEISSLCPVPEVNNITERDAGTSSINMEGNGSTDNVYRDPFDSTERLEKLRTAMRKANISVYIVLSMDDHQSEYVAPYDRRIQFVSGFSGSSGTAVVTLNSAALWTDSRYYLQAQNQLDRNWILMKEQEKDTPKIPDWIKENLEPGEAVSSDPRICPCETWKSWSKKLAKKNITMTLVEKNLIDEIRADNDGKGNYSSTPVRIHNIRFSGVSWQEKLSLIREDMVKEEIDVLVLTSLEEIAWLLNLRGDDIPFMPVFRSYMIIESTAATLYIPLEKVTRPVEEHLNAGAGTNDSVRISDYENVWKDLEAIGEKADSVGLPTLLTNRRGVSYSVCQAIPPEKVVDIASPVNARKAIKNEVEAAGMRASHVRDAVALCRFLTKIEREIMTGNDSWTELKAVRVLDNMRTEQEFNMGLSFGTISAFGAHSALPHYEPTPESDSVIDNTKLYMVDSGGQYLDGTTDVTRTVHFGNPRQIEKEIYTRLLIGCINLVTVIFKKGYDQKNLDILVRQPLFELGLNYDHGTSHGIGSYLGVHEGFYKPFEVNYFCSQEPGYYKANDFGMRLENIVATVSANLSVSMSFSWFWINGFLEGPVLFKHLWYLNQGNSNDFLTFETVTMVPYERKLILPEMLEPKHIKWLNNYHMRVRESVGTEMLKQGLVEEYLWLIQKTEPIYNSTREP